MRIKKVQSLILIQIVMVSAGTHLVNYHESQFKKQKTKLCITVYYNKIYTPSIVKAKKYASLKVATRTATEITRTGYSTKSMFRSIDRSIFASYELLNYSASLVAQR